MDEFRHQQVEEYARWLWAHPSGYVLNLSAEDHGMLHDAECPHIQVYADDKNVGRPKICARRIREIREWAGGEGVSISWCQTCQG